MEIRKPTESELKDILSLSPQAVLDGTLGQAKLTYEKVNSLIESLLKKGCYYLIASEKNEVLGWILIGGSKDQFTDEMNGFIYELFVREEFRGNGISKRLVRAAIEHIKQDGYSEVRLSAFAGNKAIKLYEKMGFQLRTVTMSLPLQE